MRERHRCSALYHKGTVITADSQSHLLQSPLTSPGVIKCSDSDLLAIQMHVIKVNKLSPVEYLLQDVLHQALKHSLVQTALQMAAVYVYDQVAAFARIILVSNSLSYDFCTSHVPSLIDSGVSSSFLASFLSTWQCPPSSCQDPPLGAGLCTPPYFLSVGDHTLSVWFTTTTLFFLTDLQLHTSLHPSPCRLFKVTAYLHRFTVTFNDRDNRGCILQLLTGQASRFQMVQFSQYTLGCTAKGTVKSVFTSNHIIGHVHTYYQESSPRQHPLLCNTVINTDYLELYDS